jgi:hypothetical protein
MPVHGFAPPIAGAAPVCTDGGVTIGGMADPVTLAIASSVAGRTAQALTEQGQQIIAVIIGKIREKLISRQGDVAVLDAAANDASVAESLAGVLGAEFTADPRFREEIEALWRQATQVKAVNAVTNVVSGTARNVIQARDVGSLTINY